MEDLKIPIQDRESLACLTMSDLLIKSVTPSGCSYCLDDDGIKIETGLEEDNQGFKISGRNTNSL